MNNDLLLPVRLLFSKSYIDGDPCIGSNYRVKFIELKTSSVTYRFKGSVTAEQFNKEVGKFFANMTGKPPCPNTP